jgi:hypothetical protein
MCSRKRGDEKMFMVQVVRPGEQPLAAPGVRRKSDKRSF